MARRGKKKHTVLEAEVLPAEQQASTAQQSEDESVALPAETAGLQPEVLEPEDDSNPELDSDEAESSAPIPYDPLHAYLREVNTYPQLNREEEQQLALRYYHKQDIDAAYRLVTSNLLLVVKIARDYERAARSVLDLIQEGNIGLMEAVKNFDPYRGVRFPSYAVWWIKAYIIRYIIANWRMVKIGTTQAQRKLFFNLKKEKEKLEREGFYPGPKLLAEKLDVRESDIVEMEQRLQSPDVSVDAPLQSDSEQNLLGILPAQALSAEELLAEKEFRDVLNKGLDEFAATLKSKEKAIFEQRLLGEEKATLHELSEQLSVSKERIRQIENKIKEKLKLFLLEKYSSLVDSFEQEKAE